MSDRSKWKVHGPVRVLKTEFAEWDLSQAQWGPPKFPTVYAFRPDGKISEIECHNPDGSITHRKWLYDGAGRLVEKHGWKNDEAPIKTLYFYDEAERHVRTVDDNHEGTQRESECCTYDSRGRKTQVRFLPTQKPNMFYSYGVEGTETSFDATGAATMTVTHDEGDQPTEVLFHDADGHLIRRVTFVRDSEGRLVREENYFGEQPPFPKLSDSFKGASPEDRVRATVFLSKVFDPRRAVASTTYQYDKDGRLSMRNRYMAGVSEESTTFRYDDKGNPTEEATEETSREVGIDEQGELRTASENTSKRQVRFNYTYDAKGNWIERVGLIRYEQNTEFQRSNIERREIIYYEN